MIPVVSQSVSFCGKTLLAAAFALVLLGLGEARAADGDLAWAGGVSAGSVEIGYGTCFDDNGNVLATGYYVGTVDLDPGTGTDSVTSAGAADIYVYKLDSSGNYVWGRSIGGTNADLGNSVATDSSGNVYLTGQFIGTTDLDPGPGTYSLTSNGSYDLFVMKLDSSGNFEWAASAGSSAMEFSQCITVDDDGNVYVAGLFENTVDFDPGAGIYNLTMNGTRDGFVLKLDTDGNFEWATAVGSAGSDTVYAIALDGAGNLSVGGGISGFWQYRQA